MYFRQIKFWNSFKIVLTASVTPKNRFFFSGTVTLGTYKKETIFLMERIRFKIWKWWYKLVQKKIGTVNCKKKIYLCYQSDGRSVILSLESKVWDEILCKIFTDIQCRILNWYKSKIKNINIL